MLATVTTVLAHQGGWDEALMVLTPILVLALLLTLANRRANQARARQADQADQATGDQIHPT